MLSLSPGAVLLPMGVHSGQPVLSAEWEDEAGSSPNLRDLMFPFLVIPSLLLSLILPFLPTGAF